MVERHGFVVAGPGLLRLLAEPRRLVFRVVQLREAVGDFATADEELETVGNERVLVAASSFVETADRAVHAGRSDFHALGVHAPPIDLSSTYPVKDLELARESFLDMAEGRAPSHGEPIYARLHNPTVARYEEVLAYLEYDPRALLENMRRDCEMAVRVGRLSVADSREVLKSYETGLAGSTYLE